MWDRTPYLTRMFIIALTVLGLFGAGTTLASAQGEICRPNGALALADGNGDGVVSLGEIDGVIAAVGGNADLQAARDQAAAAGITGIRYTGCTPDGGGGDAGNGGAGNVDTGTGTTGSGTVRGGDSASVSGGDSASVTGANGQAAQGVVSAAGGTGSNRSSNSLAVTTLPATGAGEAGTGEGAMAPVPGSIMLFLGAGSLLAFAGAFMFFRPKRA